MNYLNEEKQKKFIFYPENNLNEKNRINFLIEGDIIIIEEENLLMTLVPLLNNIKEYYDKKEKYYKLPKFINKETLSFFFELIQIFNEEDNIEKNIDLNIDFTLLRKLFEISIFFQYIEIIEIIVKNYLIPLINNDNCLILIKTYIDFLYDNKVKEIFRNFIEKCFSYLNENLIFFISEKKEEFLNLTPETIEEIIDRYFKSFYSPLNIEENKLIFDIIMNNRNINNDLFELLENERKNAIFKFESILNNLEPTLLLNIRCSNLNQDILENEDTIIEGIKIRLISYFDCNNDIFKLAMEIIDEEETLDDSIEKKTNLNSNEKNIIISLLSYSEIKEIKFKSKMNFNCIFPSSKNKYLIFKLQNFREHSKNIISETGEEKLTLQLYFSRSYIFPSVLYQILKNFKEYYSLNSISNLPRSALNLIFKNNIINNENEDQKLTCILNWLKGKNNQIIENSLDLFQIIKWEKIKNENLIDFLMNQGKLISLSNNLKNIIFKEFQRRFQKEYNYYNMTSITESSITNSSFNISLNNKNENDNNLYVNFTFNVLSKILSYTSKLDLNYIEDEKKETQSNISKNDSKENKITNYSFNSKNKIPYVNKTSFREESNKLYSNFLVKKVNNNKSNKILSERNIKDIPPTNNTKSKYIITNNSMLSNNNNSTISYKNNNTSIVSNSKIEKNIINRVLNKGIRANTPNNFLYDKNSYNSNNENDVFNDFLFKEKNSKNNDKSNSRSVDKNNVKKNNFSLQKKLVCIDPKYIINITNESNNKSPKNLSLYSLHNKENKRENSDVIPFQKSSTYYKMKINYKNENTLNIKKINKNNSSHLRSRSNH